MNSVIPTLEALSGELLKFIDKVKYVDTNHFYLVYVPKVGKPIVSCHFNLEALLIAIRALPKENHWRFVFAGNQWKFLTNPSTGVCYLQGLSGMQHPIDDPAALESTSEFGPAALKEDRPVMTESDRPLSPT